MPSHGPEAEQANEVASRLGWRGWVLVFLLIVVSFACAAGYFSASLRLQRTEAVAAQERARMQSEATATRDALLRRAAAERSVEAKDVLRMASLSLSWAVRRALDEKDKALERRPAAEVFPNARLDPDAPAVHEGTGSLLEAVVPIMSLNARLGTLIVDYEPPARPELGYSPGP